MNRDELHALLTLSGIEPVGVEKIRNGYWPAHENYNEIRNANPWWLVTLDEGQMTIGRRKKVINIDWSKTKRRGEVTSDDVTKDDVMVHAWNFGDAVKYLRAWRELPTVEAINVGIKEFNFDLPYKLKDAGLFFPETIVAQLIPIQTMLESLPEGTVIKILVRVIGDYYSIHIRYDKVSIDILP